MKKTGKVPKAEPGGKGTKPVRCAQSKKEARKEQNKERREKKLKKKERKRK